MHARLRFDRLAQDASGKITRDAFLYLEPRGDEPEFAQCGTCALWQEGDRCAIHSPDREVTADASCGFYVGGEPGSVPRNIARLTPEQTGLVRRQVRCENCVAFDAGRCKLYSELSSKLSDTFDLDSRVKPRGCCNAQTPRGET